MKLLNFYRYVNFLLSFQRNLLLTLVSVKQGII